MVMGLVAVIGVVLERAAYRPVRDSPRLSAVVSALGASIFLQNALMLIYGARYQVYPDVLPQTAVAVLGLQVPLRAARGGARLAGDDGAALPLRAEDPDRHRHPRHRHRPARPPSSWAST